MSRFTIIPRTILLILLLSSSQLLWSQGFLLPSTSTVYCASWRQALQSVLPPAALSDSLIIDYTETYYDFNCSAEGFKGYFSPSRWEVVSKYGDSGVDVTGAPDVVSVEGADSTRLKIASAGEEGLALRIVLPADGYLFFNLVKIGSSNLPTLSEGEIELRLNGKLLDFHHLADGSVYTPLLPKDGTFELRLPAQADFLWSNFKLSTNAPGVIERVYQTKHRKVVQLITLEKAALTEVVFPRPDYGQLWPFLDKDGNTLTTHDQFLLYPDNDQFDLNWQDKTDVLEGEPWLKRHWHIVDPCSNNEIRYDQWWEPLNEFDLSGRF